ncbi:thrombospondin type 3 repeat-containing protein [Endothiovibrio diazotrophicus]
MKSAIFAGLLLVMGSAVAADADHDGVDDALDRCPGTAQVKRVDPHFRYAGSVNPERLSVEPRAVATDAEGCALDGDHDGVPDYRDFCPGDSAESIAKGVTGQGCPRSSDGDGTPDYRDRCPGTPRGVRADRFGCPVAG